MLSKLLHHIIYYFYHLYGKIIFGKLGKNSCVMKPMRIIGGKNIFIEQNVNILNNARIEGVENYLDKTYKPEIKFCEGSSVQQNLHLTCANRIEVGKNTAIAANVTITDIHHPYTNINIPIEQQNLEVSEVIIGEDSKIYNNAVILPGVHIGKHVTIGANSVVTKDIPDYCVAAGSPAKVIKKYNFNTNSWEKIS